MNPASHPKSSQPPLGTPSLVPHHSTVLVGLLLLLTYPWLNPFAPNPSPMMVPWLMAWACGVAAWWLAGSLVPQGGLWRGAPWVGAWLALWVFWVVLRTPVLNSETLFTVCALGLLALAVDIGARALSHEGLLRTVLWAWLLAALVSSFIALLQYLELAHYFYPLMNIATQGEAFGNLRQRNQFATLANIGLAVLLLGPLLKGAKPTGEGLLKKWWSLLWPYLAMGLLVKANVASVSRTGTIGLLLVVALAWVWRGRKDPRVKWMAIAAPVVYVLAALSLPTVGEWFTGRPGNSLFARLDMGGLQMCTSRKALYLNVMELIAQQPWLGWGWRELSFAHYQAQYSGPRFCDILDNAHNLPLQLAVELGIPAAAALMLGLLVPILLAKPWRETVGTRQVAWGVLVLLALHSMLEYPLWYGPFLMAFGLCLGLLWPDQAAASSKAGPDKPTPEPVQAAFYARTLAATAGVLAVLFAAIAFLSMSQNFMTPASRSDTLAAFNERWPAGYWLFARQTQFAHLVTTTLEESDPAQRYALASALLHYSPEPRVVAAQLEAGENLGLPLVQRQAMERQFASIYPAEYKDWKNR